MTIKNPVVSNGTAHDELKNGEFISGSAIQLSLDSGNIVSSGSDGGLFGHLTQLNGIGSDNACDYPVIDDFSDMMGYKTGCYRATNKTARLPLDINADAKSYTVFFIANNANKETYSNGDTSVTAGTLMLSEDILGDDTFTKQPRVWMGWLVYQTRYPNGMNIWVKWSPIDNRGGCGTDLSMYDYTSLNQIDFMNNDLPTGFYISIGPVIKNAPDKNAYYAFNKLAHNINEPYWRYRNIATYIVTEIFRGNNDGPVTRSPRSWKGYVWLDRELNSRSIVWKEVH